MVYILLWSSAVRVHYSQAYKKMDVSASVVSWNWEKYSWHSKLVSNLVTAAVSAILESISGLEPSSFITESRYLKLVTVSSFLSIHFDLCVDATGVVCYQLGLLGADLHAVVRATGTGIACCQKRRTRDRKFSSSDPGRSAGELSSAGFPSCWLLSGVRSTLVSSQLYVKDPDHWTTIRRSSFILCFWFYIVLLTSTMCESELHYREYFSPIYLATVRRVTGFSVCFWLDVGV